MNRADVRDLMSEIREKYPTKTIWMYTGDSWEDICDLPVMQYVDVVVDGEFHVEEKDLDSLVEAGMQVTRLLDNNKKKVTPQDARKIYREIISGRRKEDD